MSNIDSAKLFFGIVLAKLQTAFPAAIHVTPSDIWPDFRLLADGKNIAVKDGRRRSRTVEVRQAANDESMQRVYTKQMLTWMAIEGFIRSDPTSNFKYDYVLSDKSLALLGVPLSGETATIGSALGSALGRVGETVQSEVVGRLVNKLFEAAIGFSS